MRSSTNLCTQRFDLQWVDLLKQPFLVVHHWVSASATSIAEQASRFLKGMALPKLLRVQLSTLLRICALDLLVDLFLVHQSKLPTMEKFSSREQSLCAVTGRTMQLTKKSSMDNGLDPVTLESLMMRDSSTSQAERRSSLSLLAEKMWHLRFLKIVFVRTH